MFNPATPLNWLDHVIDKIDMVLIMSVNPGFGGQKFIPSALDKLRQARERIRASGREIRLEIDGGVKVDNIGAIAARRRRHVRGGLGDLRLRRTIAATIAAMRAGIAKADERLSQTYEGRVSRAPALHSLSLRRRRHHRRRRRRHARGDCCMRRQRGPRRRPAAAWSSSSAARRTRRWSCRWRAAGPGPRAP